MTVSYTSKVANAKGFGCFLKLLFRWRGSIYKLVWPDLFVFLSFYFSLSFIYRVLLDNDQQRIFERIAMYCEKYGTLIPVSFVLGFYVSFVMGRWWQQYINIPRIDTLALWVNASIVGDGEKERLLRRTIMRYTCLTITQTFIQICPRVKKRFPTLEHLIEAGILMEAECKIIKDIKSQMPNPNYTSHWIPLVWATSLVSRARREDKLKNDSVVKSIIDEINKIKDQCFMLLSFDAISVPLVYTQVVTLSVYTYFLSCIMGRQWVSPVKPTFETLNKSGSSGSGSNSSGKYGVDELDLFIPVFTILQFFFYMGWLKVAESLLNPFGDDDDDFELNWLIDRNLQVSYLIVDEMHHDSPQLLKDLFWEVIVPEELPYTVASEQFKDGPPVSSTAHINISRDEGEIIAPASLRSIIHMPGSTLIDGGAGGQTTPGILRKTPSVSNYGGRLRTTSSTRSNQSLASRKGSVSGSKLSLFKRMISRQHSRSNVGGGGGDELLSGATTPPLVVGSLPHDADDTIPELDENMITIVSVRKEEERPTVLDIFGPSANPSSISEFPSPSSDFNEEEYLILTEILKENDERDKKDKDSTGKTE